MKLYSSAALLFCNPAPITLAFTSTSRRYNDNLKIASVSRRSATQDDAGDDAVRVAALLQELDDFKKHSKEKLDWVKSSSPELLEESTFVDMYADERKAKADEYMEQSLVSLKGMLCKRLKRKSIKGNKPALAKQLADMDLMDLYGESANIEAMMQAASEENIVDDAVLSGGSSEHESTIVDAGPISEFAGLTDLSKSVGTALGLAQFYSATPTQDAAILPIYEGKSVIVHAETGSGKTLAYLVPIIETMAKQRRRGRTTQEEDVCLIMTPTRELAAQVAGVANALAPKPDMVRLVSKPTNLMNGGEQERLNGKRIIIGSAKAILVSLYGDGKMAASPTPKPLTSKFVSFVKWLVMDEVDKLLNVKKNQKRKHDKPAALVATAVSRASGSKLQVVAASATVGRPMRRELARVLRLDMSDCPEVVRPGSQNDNSSVSSPVGTHVGRAITIPSTVRNYYATTDGESVGSLLVEATNIIKNLKSPNERKILLVLTRGIGISVANTVGSLKHFRVQPEPRGLLDMLESDSDDKLIEVHRKVSGATGVGLSKSKKDDGYLLVTVEDSVRGLHLDGLDTVLVIGRPAGPDEYTHIAGRTGRAGNRGTVINLLSHEQAASLKSWETMLGVPFLELEAKDASSLIYT